MTVGDWIDITGRLVRDGGGFALRCDAGGSLRLDLPRTPVDQVERHVRITGHMAGDALVDVDAVIPA